MNRLLPQRDYDIVTDTLAMVVNNPDWFIDDDGKCRVCFMDVENEEHATDCLLGEIEELYDELGGS